MHALLIVAEYLVGLLILILELPFLLLGLLLSVVEIPRYFRMKSM